MSGEAKRLARTRPYHGEFSMSLQERASRCLRGTPCRPGFPKHAPCRAQEDHGDQPADDDVRPSRAGQADQSGSRENPDVRSEEHTSELQSLMRISYAVFCLQKKKEEHTTIQLTQVKNIIKHTN